jgi:polar amino acid transport system substrate-binding protein
VVIYGVIAVQCISCFWLLVFRISQSQRKIARPVALLFLFITIISVTRVVIAVFEGAEGNFFNIQTLGTATLLIYTVLIFLVALAELFLLASILHDGLRQQQQNLNKIVMERTEQLVQAEKLATLGTLSAGIAHEINNPSNFILMNTEILEKGCIALQENYLPGLTGANSKVGCMALDEFMRRLPAIVTDIHDGARRIARIVADLKEYASPSQKSNMEFNLNEAALTAANISGLMVTRATEHFHKYLHSKPIMIQGYLHKLEHAINNLLQNAAQSLTSTDQSITLITGIDSEKRSAFVEVRDEGRGISSEIVQYITDPFFTTRRDEGGTGLGLWMVQHIVGEHKGELLIDSQVGKGTTMRIVLPA